MIEKSTYNSTKTKTKKHWLIQHSKDALDL